MDPESAQIKIKEIEGKKLQTIGWYHSHPTFEVNPSHIDVQNHEMYQKMFLSEGMLFIGLIISPYSHNQEGNQKINCIPKLRCFVTVLNA